MLKLVNPSLSRGRGHSLPSSQRGGSSLGLPFMLAGAFRSRALATYSPIRHRVAADRPDVGCRVVLCRRSPTA